ncbi:uncharacterized protein [Haliotis cracherodii]|uniref:uncharacterized protein n=1 Tax=Haliotis cracherodii TaxID=6455 RepID=UPI0039E970B6
MTEMNGPNQAAPSSPTPGTPLPLGSLEDKLRLAASKGLVDKVQELLQAGATSHPDRDGRTALQYAALNGQVEVCKMLVQQDGDKDAQDALGYTALHRAASQGHAEVIETLVEAGCAIDKQDKNGNTAMHEAAWNGFSKTVEMLVKHECDTFVANKGGFTALHLAAQNGHNESSRVLLYAGCDSDLKNNYGDTALHTAARYGHAGVTRILLSARCRINEQNKNGDTCLHIASALKRRKIAKLLVESGIDVQIKNKQNETAMDVARRKEHPEIIIIIQSFARPKTPKSPKSPRPMTRTHPNVVTFKDEIQVDMEGPVVVPDIEQPIKSEKPEKERKFFFFKKKKKDKEKTPPPMMKGPGQTPSPRGDNSGPAQPWSKPSAVQGFFSQYVPQTGIQYYRDLAGNIKQGPVGYTPLCQCGPTLKRLEHKIETNRDNMVDHTNASHQLLKGQIDHLDRRTAQQVFAIDKLTKERLENEHKICQSRIKEHLHHERKDTRHMFNQYNEQIQTWLDSKLASYGHCLNHHHDDSALPPRTMFTDFHENENGRLFRSRSDETLSVSDYSGKYRKKDFYESRHEAMQLIRAWQVPSYRQSARRRERNNNTINNNVTVTKAEIHGKMDRIADGASPKYEGSPNRQMMGHYQNMISPSANSPIDVSAIKRETGNQGAIPKRLPHSHSWQHPVSQSKPELSRSREVSPQVHGASRSREGSPLDVRSSVRPILRSHTDSGALSNHMSMPKQNLSERGPPNTRNMPGAPEVPQKPPKPSTGQLPNPTMFTRQNSGGFKHTSGGFSQSNVGFTQNNGGINQNTRGFTQNNAGFTQNNAGFTQNNAGFTQNHAGFTQNNAGMNHSSMAPSPVGGHNQRNNQTYMYLEEAPMPKYKPRTRSTDTLLADDKETFAQHVSRSKSLDRPLDEMDRNSGGGDKSGVVTHPAPRSSGFQHGVPENKHGVAYRVPPTNNPSASANLAPARNSMAGYRESPYASVREMQKVANSVKTTAPSPKPGFPTNAATPSPKPGFQAYTSAPSPKPGFPAYTTAPSPKPGFQAYDSSYRRDPVRESGRDSNYADISQFNKDRPPYRSMYGIHGDKGNYGNYESMPIQNSVSKSENNLLKNSENTDVKSRPSKPPPYGYRYADSGANLSGNQGNSASNNNANSTTNHSQSGNYSNYPVNSPNNNAPTRTGSVTPVSGRFGSGKISDNNNTVVNHVSNHSNNVTNTGNNSQDSFNLSPSECLRHESPYPRTSVYNPTYLQNKEDSTCSSNQDSGYSSKAKLPYLGQSPNGLPSNSGTPSSSFSMDRSLSTGTPSQNNSPFVPQTQSDSPFINSNQSSSPFTPVIATSSPFSPPKESTPAFNYSSNANYEQHTPRQPVNIQSHVNGWYEKKLLEAAEKLRNSEQYGGAHNYNSAPINYDPVNGSDV